MNLLGLNQSDLRKLQIVDWAYTEESIPLSYDHYDEWVSKDLAGPLKYLTDDRKELRSDLKNVYPEFQSALVFLFDYTAEKKRLEELEGKLEMASYVSGFDGIDYHYWIKDKLTEITKELNLVDAFFSIDVLTKLTCLIIK
jgi:epoxyqueuosine reductase